MAPLASTCFCPVSVCFPPLPRSSVRICMVLNFLLKNHLSSAVEAACIYEALKDLMHYVAQMVTLEKKSQLAEFKYRISLNCGSPFICCNTLINGTKKQEVSHSAIYFYFPPNINATSTVNLKNLI